MAIGEFAKQLAQQTIADTLAPSPAKPAAPPPPQESACTTMLNQVQAMQRALKDDEELAITFQNGAESIRVHEFFVPSAQVMVMSGVDSARNVTRVMSHVAALQLVCKVMKVAAGAKPLRINFIGAKTKPE